MNQQGQESTSVGPILTDADIAYRKALGLALEGSLPKKLGRSGSAGAGRGGRGAGRRGRGRDK